MSSDVKRIEPLEHRGFWLLAKRASVDFDLRQVRSDMFYELLRALAPARDFPNPQDVAPHVTQIQRIQAQDLRLDRNLRQHCTEFFRSRRAHVTQVLRHN